MKQNKINVYILRVSKEGIQYKGYFQQMENTLEAEQRIVGGRIEVVPLTPEIDLILKADGKSNCVVVREQLEDKNSSPQNVILIAPELDLFMRENKGAECCPVNRLWVDENNNPVDVIVGNIICVRHCGDEFISVKTEDREVIEKKLVPIRGMYKNPQDILQRVTFVVTPEDELPDYTGD